MKNILASVLLSLLVMLGWSAYIQEDGSIPDRILQKTSVQINDNCSGVVVSSKKGLVATASHCVQDERKPFKLEFISYNEDGTEKTRNVRYAQFIKKSTFSDVALLKVTGGLDAYEEVRINTEVPRRGTRVYIIGNPLGWEGYITEGVISNNHFVWPKGLVDGVADHGGAVAYVSDALINPGNSGGPVVNAQGELIGLSNWKSKDGYSLITRSEYVLALMKGVQ